MFRPRARADSEGLASEVKTSQRNARSIPAMKLLAKCHTIRSSRCNIPLSDEEVSPRGQRPHTAYTVTVGNSNLCIL